MVFGDSTKISSMTELQSALKSYKAGDKVTLTVARQSGRQYEESIPVRLRKAVFLPTGRRDKLLSYPYTCSFLFCPDCRKLRVKIILFIIVDYNVYF